MRIFLVLHPSGNMSVPGSLTWYKNLYEPLLDLEHDVFLLRLDDYCTSNNLGFRTAAYKEQLSNDIVEIFKKEHKREPFDLFFSYFTKDDIFPEVITEIKKLGLPTLNFSCNNTHQFYLVEGLAKVFDYSLYSEKEAKCKFDALGLNSIWFQMAANPTYYHPVSVKKEFDMTFIGSRYARRAYYVRHLLENGIDLNCFGGNWKYKKPYPKARRMYKEFNRTKDLLQSFITFNAISRFKLSNNILEIDSQNYLLKVFPKKFNYPISDDEMVKTFSKSKINLGFLEVFSTDNNNSLTLKQHIHLREFEVPMSGGLYMTNFSDELAEHYVPDEEVIVFNNEYELLDKAKFYIANEGAANKIREAGYKRAIKCHTYQIRYKSLFNSLNFK